MACPSTESRTIDPQERALLDSLRGKIDARLQEFKAVPRSRWCHEIAFCLLTPQSSAYHAADAMRILEAEGFFSHALSVESIARILRMREHYIRFHNTKAARLVAFLAMWPSIATALSIGSPPSEEREVLLDINGLGLKEASHALRNIGRRDLAILDRHILRELVAHRVIRTIPSSLTPARYLTIEKKFSCFAREVGESMDHLDLLFWAKAGGSVFK